MFIGLVGTAASVAGAVMAPNDFYSAYLTVYVLGLSLSLGCMAILMMYHLVGGGWGTVARRTLESGMMTLPLMAVLFIPFLFRVNQQWLYEWARPAELKKSAKLADIAHSYLNSNAIMMRAALYFALWLVMAYLLNRWSTQQDSESSVKQSTLRFRAISGFGMVIYSLSFSFGIIDWVMSLQARWMSSTSSRKSASAVVGAEKSSTTAGAISRRAGTDATSSRSFPVTQCLGASKCVPVCSPLRKLFQYHAGPRSS
jgi:hypothetical protein